MAQTNLDNLLAEQRTRRRVTWQCEGNPKPIFCMIGEVVYVTHDSAEVSLMAGS